MTKMHFETIAKALLLERPGENWDANKRVQWELDVKAVANALAWHAPRFDRARFLRACGLES